MKRIVTFFYFLALAASLFFASWCILHGTIHFQGDLARDFLLFEEIAVTRKPVLIGPRTSMLGVFHGPAWLYLNLPVFMLSGGNPVASGWFWVAFLVAGVWVFHFVAKKLLPKNAALPATALYALSIASSAPYLYNPYGAVFIAPLLFYFFILYKRSHSFLHLIICLFLAGLTFQFEMVWGVPALFVIVTSAFLSIFKRKQFAHLFAFFILLIPFSTFILFDLRHDFFQTKSFITYIVGQPGKAREQVDMLARIVERLKDMLLVLPSYFSHNISLLSGIFAFITLGGLLIFRNNITGTFLLFYGVFWLLTLPLKGKIYDYYYWAFLPLFCLVLGALISGIFKKRSSSIFAFLILLLLFFNIKLVLTQNDQFFRTNTGLWQFYSQQAEKIYKDANTDFGWYVYTADQYAYSFKYAMSYVQSKYPSIRAYKFEKKPLTYLMIYPSDNKYTNEAGWKTGQVKINKKLVKIIKSIGGSYAEKYFLTEEEQAIQADSSLLQDLTFR
jgi:hypothetical protein